MIISTLYAELGCDNDFIGKLSTEKPYTRTVAIRLRNKLLMKFPKAKYFRLEQKNVSISNFPPGYSLIGEKGAQYIIKINSRTGKQYRRYLSSK